MLRLEIISQSETCPTFNNPSVTEIDTVTVSDSQDARLARIQMESSFITACRVETISSTIMTTASLLYLIQ